MLDDSLDRTPPNNLTAEQSVLGAMLLSPEAIGQVVDVVKPDDFYRTQHETVFRAILARYGRGESADMVTILTDLLAAKEVKPGFLDGPYLHTLTAAAPGAVVQTVRQHAQIVQRLAQRRRVIEVHRTALNMAYGSEGDTEDILSESVTRLLALSNTDGDRRRRVGDLMPDTLDEIEAVSLRGEATGIGAGLMDLDDVFGGGFQPGQLVVVAGRPGSGKSLIATMVARVTAIRDRLPTLLFSLEMPRNEIAKRILAAEARVPLGHIIQGGMTEDDWGRLAASMERVSEAPLWIDDTATMTTPEMLAVARRIKERHGLACVEVDYLQLVSEVGRGENRQAVVAANTRAMKLMAMELGVPVILLAQLNRNPENRADKRPLLTDLRESGEIEQSADIVILLHREELSDPDSLRVGEADLIVAKHRNGETRTVSAAFQGHYARFVDMADDMRGNH